ncbi:MAG: HemK2/MTQ2 family protein methyltransferase [Candidatus Micrarchaeia archaeon]
MLEIDGLEIEESELVYKPAEDSFLAMKAISKIASKMGRKEVDVADIGTGTGLLGIYAASMLNTKRLVLADINQHAVELAKRNYQLNKLKLKNKNADVEIVRSDLLQNIHGSFDLIIFNAPYLRGSISSHLPTIEKAWNGGRRGIEVSEEYLNEAQTKLRENGTVLLIASSLSDFEGLKERIKELGYRIDDIIKEHYFFEDIIALTLKR